MDFLALFGMKEVQGKIFVQLLPVVIIFKIFVSVFNFNTLNLLKVKAKKGLNMYTY